MSKFGIDISHWQGNFNLAKAKENGAEFVIIKCGGSDCGVYIDSAFNRFYNEAKAAGLPVGVYWFSNALTEADAIRDAEYLIKYALAGKQFELPIYIDIETKDQLSLPKSKLTSIVLAWLKHMEEHGYFAGIYASKWTFTDNLDDSKLSSYTHWIAQWDTKCTYTGKYGMWQFGGEINKIRSPKFCGQTIDQNYMYEDFPIIIKKAGLNGYVKEKDMTKEEVLEIIKEYEASKDKRVCPLWAQEELAEAVELGITDGSKPLSPCPRYQVALMCKRTYTKVIEAVKELIDKWVERTN